MIAALIALLAMPQVASPIAQGTAQAGNRGGGSARVSMGVLVRPESVTVGEPFTVTLRVRAPLGADIGLPVGPDSGLSVEAVDPPVVRVTGGPSVVERTATFRLVAWDTGAQSSRLGNVVVTSDGRALSYHISGDTVRVRSVLPSDSALRKPKVARDVIAATRPWWVWAALGLAAVALTWLVSWWWRRRVRRRGVSTPLDAIAAARRDFARIDALGLLAAGEPGRHVALTIDALRDYLAARVPAAQRSLTGPELLAVLHDVPVVRPERLAPLLAESDLIKFGRRPVAVDRAAGMAGEGRALVEDIERALVEQAAAARAAEKAA